MAHTRVMSAALGPPLPLRFYRRDPREVAPELIGCRLVRHLPNGQRLVLRLTEVEAYLGDGTDPASHSHSGPTRRNRSMFGPPGRVYAYRSYGIHTCLNVVCEAAGRGSAVLLRAAEPIEGQATMALCRALLPDTRDARLSVGPGRLAQAVGLELEIDGACLRTGPLTLHAPAVRQTAPNATGRGPRVGIRLGADLPYRYFETCDTTPGSGPSAWVSKFRAGGRRRRDTNGEGARPG
jgi:DNA-3-methyladenine glycosylase